MSYRVTDHLRHRLRHTALYYVTNLKYLVIANHLSTSGLWSAPLLTHTLSGQRDNRGAGDTEGDFAKVLAVAGLGVVGHDNFGIFPLCCKLLNMYEAKHDQIMKNEEIQNITDIMGLQHNRVAATFQSASSFLPL